MRYSYIFVPVEIGLEFLLTSRLRWLENELKIKTKPESVNEMQFDGIPETVLEGMNEKKYTLLDHVMLKLEMVLEKEKVFVVATEPVLGSSKTLLGTLEKQSETFTDFPSSLKCFESGILVGDVTQRDTRRNKCSYQLKSTAVEDQVLLIWVSNEDLKLVNQRKKDQDLVDMAKAVKLNEVVAAEGSSTVDQENVEDDLGDEAGESFKDTEEPGDQQWHALLFTRKYFGQNKKTWSLGARVCVYRVYERESHHNSEAFVFEKFCYLLNLKFGIGQIV